MNTVVRPVGQFLADLLIFVLVALGFSGTIYKALGPEGWLETTLGGAWQSHPELTIATVALGVGALFFARPKADLIATHPTIGDRIMYAWIIVGVYFAFKLVTEGHL